MPKPAIGNVVLFRSDLRIMDNPALTACVDEAVKSCAEQPPVGLYLLSKDLIVKRLGFGIAKMDFILRAVDSLRQRLADRFRMPLITLVVDDPDSGVEPPEVAIALLVLKFCAQFGVQNLFANRGPLPTDVDFEQTVVKGFIDSNRPTKLVMFDADNVLPPRTCNRVVKGQTQTVAYGRYTLFFKRWLEVLASADNRIKYLTLSNVEIDRPQLPWWSLKSQLNKLKSELTTNGYRLWSYRDEQNESEIAYVRRVLSLLSEQSLTVDELTNVDGLDLAGVRAEWPASESAALDKLVAFVNTSLAGYEKQRDEIWPSFSRDSAQPATTSKLSPYLAEGVLSMRLVLNVAAGFHTLHKFDSDTYYVVGQLKPLSVGWNFERLGEGRRKFIGELAWREFYHHFYYDRWEMMPPSLHPQCADLAAAGRTSPQFGGGSYSFWETDVANNDLWLSWSQGRTGYPLVDAAIRCLNSSGYLHNRLRMLVACFLTKHLLIAWQVGETYFRRRLLDADPLSNVAGWRWTSSAPGWPDAQPPFRIFNPFTQAARYDAEGKFVCQYVAELKSFAERGRKALASGRLMPPGDADARKRKTPLATRDLLLEPAAFAKLKDTDGQLLLRKCNYPLPVVLHEVARQRALKLFKSPAS